MTIESSPKPPQESIRRRYLTTLFSQGIQMMLGVIEASFVPRALGPVIYGNYSFLYSSAAKWRSAADLGAQQLVFTLSSKSARTGALTKLYGIWLIIQLLALFAVIGICARIGIIDRLWPSQKVGQILLITFLEWAIFAVARLAQLGDSKGFTVRTQAAAAAVSLVTALALLGLAAARRLEFYSYAVTLLLTAILNASIFSVYLYRHHGAQLWDERLKGRVRPYLKQWWGYSSPLVATNLYGLFLGWLDTYLIQRLYGSTEQAYFALSSAVSAGVFVFTGASINVFWRELAQSLGQNDRDRAARIYRMFSQMLFFLTLALSFWFSINARLVVSVLAGHAYDAAIPVMMVMAFYPLQQTLGQINIVTLLASEQTIYYRNLEIALSVPGLAATYFLLASRHAWIPGLGLGAKGLALKFVVLGLLTVQFYEYRACRLLHVSYFRAVIHKCRAAIIVGATAGVFLVILPRLGPAVSDPAHKLLMVGLASTVYLVTLLGITYRWPDLCGLDREHIRETLRSVFSPKSPQPPSTSKL